MASLSVFSFRTLSIFLVSFIYFELISCAVLRELVKYPTVANHKRMYWGKSSDQSEGITTMKPLQADVKIPEPKLKLKFVDEDMSSEVKGGQVQQTSDNDSSQKRIQKSTGNELQIHDIADQAAIVGS